MSIVIRTDEVAPAERLEFVQEMTAATWVPMECRFEHAAADYWAVFRASGLGPMQVVVMDVMPIKVRRTTPLIEQADPDLFKLFMVCDSGRSTVDQDGQQSMLANADFSIYDTRRPYEVNCGVGQDRPVRLLTFMFPPSLLPVSAGRLRRLAAMRIPATAGVGDLTAQFLLQLARNIDDYSPAEAARLSTAALEVLGTRLARELDVRDWGTPESRRHALLTTVQAFIQQNLGDSGVLLNHLLEVLPGNLQKFTRTLSYGSWFNYYLCGITGTIGISSLDITLPIIPIPGTQRAARCGP